MDSQTAIYLLLAFGLLLLNTFFVLAEFAAVKARPTRMEELAASGNRRAVMVQHIQLHLDEYLAVCQVGITLASIGLGFVGEPAIARLLLPLFDWAGAAKPVAVHGLALTAAYILVSFMHIVIGEQVPKIYAIRKTDATALAVAVPMRLFYYLFYFPLWGLNFCVSAVLWVLRVRGAAKSEFHSEDEIRLILSDSQSGGMMSFRRLLYIENVLDLGALTVRNAMKPRTQARCLNVAASRAENDRVIAETRYSRYPLLGSAPEKPLGIIHVKELYLAEKLGKNTDDLQALARPYLTAREYDPLEQLLADMQRRAIHVAVVLDGAGQWTGFITMEDAIEEVIGAVEEEFPLEEPVYLADMLASSRVVLDTEGSTILEATKNALRRVGVKDLPLPLDTILLSVAEREKTVSSYVGKRLAIPHARFAALKTPTVVFARMKTPMAAPVTGETIGILLILLTPASMPRIHQVLLSRIAGIFDNDLIEARLHEAATPGSVLETIRTAEQILLA